ncbi:MAG: hypothetical protein K6T87_16730 [Roseiflexus sp.]|uniref:hypothetical protein n=1 Tax=Roseiflexus sp. TaxID=2562120 RepID=UPI0025E0A821|nr:hypothetical protein [Roseiflexus sp.]MCL6542204.1 hypothetical protein [Roseiflexus sp.]
MICFICISVGLGERRALPRPRWRVRVLRASPAPAGLRARSASVHVRAAWRALVHAHAAEPAAPPRPTLNRRAGRTTGAAAPARWGMRMRSAHLLVNA